MLIFPQTQYRIYTKAISVALVFCLFMLTTSYAYPVQHTNVTLRVPLNRTSVTFYKVLYNKILEEKNTEQRLKETAGADEVNRGRLLASLNRSWITRPILVSLLCLLIYGSNISNTAEKTARSIEPLIEQIEKVNREEARRVLVERLYTGEDDWVGVTVAKGVTEQENMTERAVMPEATGPGSIAFIVGAVVGTTPDHTEKDVYIMQDEVAAAGAQETGARRDTPQSQLSALNAIYSKLSNNPAQVGVEELNRYISLVGKDGISVISYLDPVVKNKIMQVDYDKVNEILSILNQHAYRIEWVSMLIAMMKDVADKRPDAINSRGLTAVMQTASKQIKLGAKVVSKTELLKGLELIHYVAERLKLTEEESPAQNMPFIDNGLAESIIQSINDDSGGMIRDWLLGSDEDKAGAEDKYWIASNRALNFLNLFTESQKEVMPDISELANIGNAVENSLAKYGIPRTTQNRTKMKELLADVWDGYEDRVVFDEDTAVITLTHAHRIYRNSEMIIMAGYDANMPREGVERARERISRWRNNAAQILTPSRVMHRPRLSMPQDILFGTFTGDSFSLVSVDPKHGALYSIKGKNGDSSKQKKDFLNGIGSCPKERLTVWVNGHMLTTYTPKGEPIERRIGLSSSGDYNNRTITFSELSWALSWYVRQHPNGELTVILDNCYSDKYAWDCASNLFDRLKKLPREFRKMPVIVTTAHGNVEGGKALTGPLTAAFREAMNKRNNRTKTTLLQILYAADRVARDKPFPLNFDILVPIDLEGIQRKFPEADFEKDEKGTIPVIEAAYRNGVEAGQLEQSPEVVTTREVIPVPTETDMGGGVLSGLDESHYEYPLMTDAGRIDTIPYEQMYPQVAVGPDKREQREQQQKIERLITDLRVAGEREEAIRELPTDEFTARDEQAVKLVIESLSEGLIKIGKPAVKPLIETLGSDNFYVRRHAIDVLVKIGESSVEPLIDALKDERNSENVRTSAAEILGTIGDQRAIEPLIEALDWNPEAFMVEFTAESALRKIGKPVIIEPLIRALKHKDWHIRENVAMILGGIEAEQSIEPLIQSLGDDDERVRFRAVRVLENLCDLSHVPLLIEALQDKNPNLSSFAVMVLENVSDKRAILPLIQFLDREGLENFAYYQAVDTLRQLIKRSLPDKAVEMTVEWKKHYVGVLDRLKLGPDERSDEVMNVVKRAIEVIDTQIYDDTRNELGKKYNRLPQGVVFYLLMPEIVQPLIEASKKSGVDISYLTSVAFAEGYILYARGYVLKELTKTFSRSGISSTWPIGLDMFGSVIDDLKKQGYLRGDFGEKGEFKFTGRTVTNEAGDTFKEVEFSSVTSGLEAMGAMIKFKRTEFIKDSKSLGYDVSKLSEEIVNVGTYLYYVSRSPKDILKKYGIAHIVGEFTLARHAQGIILASPMDKGDARYTAQWPAATADWLRALGIFEGICRVPNSTSGVGLGAQQQGESSLTKSASPRLPGLSETVIVADVGVTDVLETLNTDIETPMGSRLQETREAERSI